MAIVCFYLACTVFYTLHFVLFKLSRTVLPRALRSTASLRALPAISVIVSSSLTLVAIKNQSNSLASCSEDELKINPDIGGIGVLLGMFLPCGYLLLVLESGHWNPGTFGAKELCMAQLASMLFLVYVCDSTLLIDLV